MENRGFSFLIARSHNDQFKVTVKPAERLNTKKKINRHRLRLYHYKEAKIHMQRIHTFKELFQQASGKRLERETVHEEHEQLYVRGESFQGELQYFEEGYKHTQNIVSMMNDTNYMQSIYFLCRNKPHRLAVVHIQQGAQMCFGAGYEKKLLGFIKHGIMKSLKDNMEYVITVIIEKKESFGSWVQVNINERDTLKAWMNELYIKKQVLESKRLQIAKNLFKIVQKTNMIEHLETAIEKKMCKEGWQIGAKNIPVISSILGLYFGAVRAGEGDITGAMENIVSGVLADIPVVGTTLSLVLDISILTKDITDAVQDARQLKQHEINKIIRRNKILIDEIELFCPGSPTYGNRNNAKMFDESAFAYTDNISKIHIKSSNRIVSIQIEYRFGGKKGYYGGNRGTLKTMVLYSNEKITLVQVCVSNNYINSLKFHTDMGREESFGKEFGENLQSYELFNGAYVGAIGGWVMKQPNREDVLQAIRFTEKF